MDYPWYRKLWMLKLYYFNYYVLQWFGLRWFYYTDVGVKHWVFKFNIKPFTGFEEGIKFEQWFKIHSWFQNLKNDRPKENRAWFHFRGSLGRDYNKLWFKYELSSGPACRFTFEPYNNKTRFIIGFFFFTLYFTLYGLKLPFITKGRDYGFYIYGPDLSIWLMCGRKPMESSSNDPWYYQTVIHPKDLLFGKTIHFEKEVMKNYEDIHFEFRGKEYVMNSIKVKKSNWFRSRIPYGLHHLEIYRMDLKIEKPPMHQGKGENSWDCGDDGSYGMCAPYGDGPEVKWNNKDAVFEHCCRYYCESVSKDIKKRGRVNNDRDLLADIIGFKYIGRKITKDRSSNGLQESCSEG